MAVTLTQHLNGQVRAGHIESSLQTLIESVAACCVRIAVDVGRGALGGVHGLAGTGNVHGEEQKKLDVHADEIMLRGNAWTGVVAGMASEEREMPHATGFDDAPYLLVFDPLDGSSNIDVNVSIGTIFSVLPNPGGDLATVAPYLQPGSAQVAAGYVVYGPATTLTLTTGHGVQCFTLDRDVSEFLLTEASMQVPEQTKEFAINMSNMRHWEAPVKRYVDEMLAGKNGPRGKDFNMRWIASMVADVHRVLTRGGTFMYPRDARDPSKPGKLRLMYEANPMSLLVERAGGASVNGAERILEVKPTELHQKIAVMLGSKEEIDLLASYHA